MRLAAGLGGLARLTNRPGKGLMPADVDVVPDAAVPFAVTLLDDFDAAAGADRLP